MNTLLTHVQKNDAKLFLNKMKVATPKEKVVCMRSSVYL